MDQAPRCRCRAKMFSARKLLGGHYFSRPLWCNQCSPAKPKIVFPEHLTINQWRHFSNTQRLCPAYSGFKLGLKLRTLSNETHCRRSAIGAAHMYSFEATVRGNIEGISEGGGPYGTRSTDPQFEALSKCPPPPQWKCRWACVVPSCVLVFACFNAMQL